MFKFLKFIGKFLSTVCMCPYYTDIAEATEEQEKSGLQPDPVKPLTETYLHGST